MIRLDNHLGKIKVSNEYFANLVGYVASESYGVVGLVDSNPKQGLRSWLSSNDIPDKGVEIRTASNGDLIVDLHIVVTYGVNISAIVKSIANKVAYNLQKVSGLNVARVNIYVADMQVD